jgi:hypothetical protein
MLSRLALVAALLLATLPTLGRFAMPAQAHAHAHLTMASQPMAMGHAAMPSMRAGNPPPAPPPHAHGLDCAYCALLAGVIPHAALSPVVGCAPAMQPGARPRPSMPIAAMAAGGLGARGPPRVA